MSNEQDKPINGQEADNQTEAGAEAGAEAAMQDQPQPGEAPQEVKVPTLSIDDEQARVLTTVLAFALHNMRLFEGAVTENRVSMRHVTGPLAATLAAQLVQFMRGEAPRQYSVRKTLRDLFRGIPLPPMLEEQLLALHPNSNPWGTEFTVQDDDNTPAAKIAFSVQMIPTILLPGVRPVKQ